MRGVQAPGRRVAQAFLGLFTVLGRLALGLSPIGALRLGRLARGTKPEPMVPTQGMPDISQPRQLKVCFFMSTLRIEAPTNTPKKDSLNGMTV